MCVWRPWLNLAPNLQQLVDPISLSPHNYVSLWSLASWEWLPSQIVTRKLSDTCVQSSYIPSCLEAKVELLCAVYTWCSNFGGINKGRCNIEVNQSFSISPYISLSSWSCLTFPAISAPTTNWIDIKLGRCAHSMIYPGFWLGFAAWNLCCFRPSDWASIFLLFVCELLIKLTVNLVYFHWDQINFSLVSFP